MSLSRAGDRTGKRYRRCCILLSGGMGTRLGSDIPKQYIEVGGRMVIAYTLEAISAWTSMDSLLIVADGQWQKMLYMLVDRVLPQERMGFLGLVPPGESRQGSVFNALRMAKSYMADDAWVMIHDAVRPEVSEGLIGKCDEVLSAGGCDGVMPYLPVKDTTYLTSEDGEQISANIDRDRLVAGQTPEFFDYWRYLAANESLSEEELLAVHGSTEPAVMAGMKMALVRGEESNFKITTKEDLERFRMIKERK